MRGTRARTNGAKTLANALHFLTRQRRLAGVQDISMKSKSAIQLIALLLIVAAGGGCATGYLWKDADLDACNLPADNINFQLFQTTRTNQLLVVYNEYSERHDSIHQRSYLLTSGQANGDPSRPPSFVRINSFHSLTQLPVFVTTNATSKPLPAFYAMLTPSAQTFTLYVGGEKQGSYVLPVYNDGKGQLERIALTPLAATVDLTIVGGYIGYLWLESGELGAR
jgi:hypothetical protein